MSVGLDPSLLVSQAQASLDVHNKLRVEALSKSLNAGDTEEKKLRQACRGFESAFLQKLMVQMRATVPKDGILHGPYEDQYLSMFDQAMADKMAESGGIGLADMMYSQLKDKIGGSKDAASRSGQGSQAGQAEGAAGAGRDAAAKPEVETGAAVGSILPANRPVLGGGLGLDRLPGKAVSAAAPSRISHDVFHSHPSHALFLSSGPDASGSTPKTGREQAASELTAPVTGTITSSYGWRGDPFTGKTAWHAGLDIAASTGEPVAACWDGQVVFAGQKAGYGNTVILEHQGGWRSVYGHLSQIDVSSGDSVAAGRKIAEVGSTGRSTGPHLHFELRYADASVDPLSVGIWTANNAPPGQTARETGHTEGGGHDLANHRKPGQTGEGLVASGRASEGRIYPPEGA
ncbi:peptidoglycan DD-metalloendopeptidase family protein [Desulfolutivibrio sulfoxidireducens]|uniref:peptidoglycan DD-metalloendopeptidase family protein n=1 Tax=Desulfolutivibrio sulfoxidireducens TaxID=2773299 RepID=UPI00159E0FEF|nr:peptidoglycan DD-metalloendopeptidase family protein [Desulfolutivibrio sulfoxidireducens]QLA16861.1 peptidoglycan DD-metalloendopeptidase family protein [Desulfolutivibrio sulfoxidireducens]QLA20426.1 peptidoglycan DD-metalloendopeptidase family protein [Desulfolutivibrio sulfoxidireducens]